MAVLFVAGCMPQPHQVRVDPKRLVVGESLPAMRCAYHLAGVVDERPNGEHIGGLGPHRLLFDDAPTIITTQLIKAGLQLQATPAAARVMVKLKRLYLSQTLTSKVPIVVYEVTISDGQPFLLRTSQTSVNWNGSQNEAISALSQALQTANVQLISALNERCPT